MQGEQEVNYDHIVSLALDFLLLLVIIVQRNDINRLLSLSGRLHEHAVKLDCKVEARELEIARLKRRP
jgi:hypothetical protein